MREIRTSGSVGAAGGNSRGDPTVGGLHGQQYFTLPWGLPGVMQRPARAIMRFRISRPNGGRVKRYVVKPGAKVKLADWDPRETGAFSGGKEKAEARLLELNGRLESLQELLYAEHKHKVLVILQAMDTGGKDGTIRKVFDRVNPQGVRVASFKAPTPIELDHDYLWRVHQQIPGRGEIVVFNRSHYEDVLVVRVHGLVPPEVWKRRYAQINDFERLLSEEGTTILKFYLHIDQDEQKERLQERLDEPEEALEVQRRRPGGAQALGRVHEGLRGRPRAHEHRVGAVAHRPGQPQLVPQPRGRRGDRRRPREARHALPGTSGGLGEGRHPLRAGGIGVLPAYPASPLVPPRKPRSSACRRARDRVSSPRERDRRRRR